jgi:predicted nucleic acid-binding protein
MSAMRGKVFCDSNVFLYSIDDLSDASKRNRCGDWLDRLTASRLATCNLQVVNEVTNVLLKKRRKLPTQQVFDYADTIAPIGDLPLDQTTITAARALHSKFGYSWWDCLLLASALELGCSHFLSEDLQDGHQIGGLTIINPFLHAPETILGSYQD